MALMGNTNVPSKLAPAKYTGDMFADTTPSTPSPSTPSPRGNAGKHRATDSSIEVIKVCIVGIAAVMTFAILILVLVVWQFGNEAEPIKGEVEQIRGEAEAIVEQIEQIEQIEHEADMIRDKIQHPLRCALEVRWVVNCKAKSAGHLDWKRSSTDWPRDARSLA